MKLSAITNFCDNFCGCLAIVLCKANAIFLLRMIIIKLFCYCVLKCCAIPSKIEKKKSLCNFYTSLRNSLSKSFFASISRCSYISNSRTEDVFIFSPLLSRLFPKNPKSKAMHSLLVPQLIFNKHQVSESPLFRASKRLPKITIVR